MFNSYVKLPEGTSNTSTDIPELRGNDLFARRAERPTETEATID